MSPSTGRNSFPVRIQTGLLKSKFCIEHLMFRLQGKKSYPFIFKINRLLFKMQINREILRNESYV